MIEVTFRAHTTDTFVGRVHEGGSSVLTISGTHDYNGLDLRLPAAWLSPEQQSEWLRRLAVAAEELAEQVEQQHGIADCARCNDPEIVGPELVRFGGAS